MSPDANKLHNLADALSEDLLAVPAEQLLAEAADDHGDEQALAAAFDRVSARATAQSRRRRFAARIRALAASISPPASWKPAMAAVAALAVVVVAGDLYIHVRPDATAPPSMSQPMPAPKSVRTVTIDESRPGTDRLARDDRMARGDAPGARAENAASVPAAAPPAVAAAPPPAPAAGAADAPKRIRTFNIQPGASDRVPVFGAAPAPRSAATTENPAALADATENKALAQQPAAAASAVSPAAPPRRRASLWRAAPSRPRSRTMLHNSSGRCAAA